MRDIELHAPANLFRGLEAVGGMLLITNEKLQFNPHSVNFQRNPLEIRVEDIAYIKKRLTWFFIPTGILIKLKSGREYKLVMWDRDRIIGRVNEAIKLSSS
ncbi:hypothetical protein OM416_16375 [Paenibacillus sp. LS1]|uniref:hypothetical protein n=1 Tax=Paenibacillus sp. LS1 TaxID=2992120 RepID=UPI002232A82D|nr:hypothetical protein [Paenibacillus sp. LS1]MCW3793167.1 hypothetical protein [Paenibacillus sp. LS1]